MAHLRTKIIEENKLAIGALQTLIRMGTAVALGGTIGFERERLGRPAGLRTHILVALASATFMLVSTQFVYRQHYTKEDLVTVDTSRIAASVVTGIGFLGAGAILKVGLNIQGLTTAASLWLVAAVGLASGGGMFMEALLATGVTLVSLLFLRRTEGKQWRLFQRQLTVVLALADVRPDVLGCLKGLGAEVAGVDYDEDLRTQTLTMHLEIRFAGQEMLDNVLTELEKLPNIQRLKVSRPQ